MGMNYEYDEEAAGRADDFANRIDESALYVVEIKRADAIESSKGTKGVYFEVEVPTGQGGKGANASFTLYTEKEDGTRIFGFNKLQAAMTILGLRSLKTAPGKVMVYDETENKRVEVDGEVFPDLIGKVVGAALEKELYTTQGGKDSYRMNLVSFFHPQTKLTASEIRERKVKPEKLERIQRTLKTRDNRVKRSAEPGQPPAGAPVEGDY